MLAPASPDHAAIWRALKRPPSTLARALAAAPAAPLVVFGTPLLLFAAFAGAEQVIGFLGWLLGAQLFDLFTAEELKLFSGLIAATLAAFAIVLGAYARHRTVVLLEVRAGLGESPKPAALTRAAERLGAALAPARARLRTQVLAVAAVVAVGFAALTFYLRASSQAGDSWPPSWRAAIVHRALFTRAPDGEAAATRPLSTACAPAPPVRFDTTECAPDGGCRRHFFVALKAGETLQLSSPASASASLLLHREDAPFVDGDFGRAVASGTLGPGHPLSLTAPRAAWYALDLVLPTASPARELPICIQLAGAPRLAPGGAGH